MYSFVLAALCGLAAGVAALEYQKHAQIVPPLHTTTPIPYCRADMRIGMPELGPGRAIVSFEPCTEGRRERAA